MDHFQSLLGIRRSVSPESRATSAHTGQPVYVVDGTDDRLEEIWYADLGLSLKAGGKSDFSRALANVDVILSAIAIGATDPCSGCGYVVGQVLDHMPQESLASDLYGIWCDLGDLHDFTAEGSGGERDVEAAIRDAAREWTNLRRDDAVAVRQYFDRWKARVDLSLWRDRLGGRTFDSLDASGWFKWDRS